MEKDKFEYLLSKNRLESYNSIDEHFDNLYLISNITPKIAVLEIILRNLLDDNLNKENPSWIFDKDNKIICDELRRISSIDKSDLTHHQYLSRFMLGSIIKLITTNRLQNKILNLKDIDYKKYSLTNRNFCFIHGKKHKFSHINNSNIVLNLLWTIRNRSFHWENLLKIREENNILFPRITTREHGTSIGIDPGKIELFLSDFIKSINEDLLNYC
ncbi:hypothetical protein A9K75_06755 [Campylobacter fetus subsp. testudinum]|uniref:hypothetical protein n=1 Tax=Campylobacter fetus TaxID=196 RepID=UPI0008189E40|nr:hypothetical protein [Campylobacter fetus]OCR99565.1 hypothetical protein A9K75_06755 [Campylobacter fetus subsp. testudinum]